MLIPVIATEIEFYLHGADEKFSPQQIIEYIKEACAKSEIYLASAEEERGPNQYEVALLPSHDREQIALDTERFKILMQEYFVLDGVYADFSAKPLADQPGSGLHVHVHLEDGQAKNVFFREGEEFSESLLHAIGGLLEFMNPCMPLFAPYEASYLRFTSKSNAPTTVSWGTNNRTVAIRIPTTPMDHKRIEHRVAGSDANIAEVIDAVLTGIYYGIENKCIPDKPVYGDASLPQYSRMLLARSLSEAKACMAACRKLPDYLRFIDCAA